MARGETRTFRAEPSELPEMDEWVEAVGGRLGSADRAILRVRLCIAEHAANVIEHGGADGSRPGEIAITLRSCGDGIEAEIADTGRRFDPTQVPDPAPQDDIETASVGERGLRLIRSVAAKLAYRHDGTHNRLLLRIDAHPSRPAEQAVSGA